MPNSTLCWACYDAALYGGTGKERREEKRRYLVCVQEAEDVKSR